MARRRRKLSPELEKEIALAKKKVELITAIINDIEDEEIQGEYITAFHNVKHSAFYLSGLYDEVGFNSDTEECLTNFNKLLTNFEQEFEI